VALVSGESVRLELPPAGLPTRIIALIIDVLVEIGLLIGLLLVLTLTGSALDEAALAALGLLLVVGCLLVLPVLMETTTGGRSIGKIAFGLRVVTDSGGRTSFRDSLVRGLLLVFVDLWTTSGAAGLITSLANPRGKRVGDYFAGTIVVRERFGAAPPAQLPAAGSQVSHGVTLQPNTVGAIEAYLGRWQSLDPDARMGLARQLAAVAAVELGRTPPADADADRFLVQALQQHRVGG